MRSIDSEAALAYRGLYYTHDHFTNFPIPSNWQHLSSMIVWRIRGKIIRTLLHCTVYDHQHKQPFYGPLVQDNPGELFLSQRRYCDVYNCITIIHNYMLIRMTSSGELWPSGLGLVSFCVCVFFLTRASLFVIGLVFVYCLVVNCLKDSCTKWPIKCWVGR